MLHCAAPHHHVHGSIAGLDGSYEHDPKPDLTRPDQTRSENLGLCHEDVFNNTQTHTTNYFLCHIQVPCSSIPCYAFPCSQMPGWAG